MFHVKKRQFLSIKSDNRAFVDVIVRIFISKLILVFFDRI